MSDVDDELGNCEECEKANVERPAEFSCFFTEGITDDMSEAATTSICAEHRRALERVAGACENFRLVTADVHEPANGETLIDVRDASDGQAFRAIVCAVCGEECMEVAGLELEGDEELDP